jgi:exosortase
MLNEAAKKWFVPLATIVVFFGILLFTLPYAAGYGPHDKVPLGTMLYKMWGLTEWGHAALVPFICLFLIFLRRQEILQAPIRGSNLLGGGLVFLGLVLYCLGLKAETEYFGFAAIQILLAGLVLWFWGYRVFGILSFAWFFFLFTYPMPPLEGIVAVPLRLLMSHTSAAVLNVLGTPSLQSGTAIFSAPDMHRGLQMGQKFEIDIADPCSGLHSLFALMMISALAGYVSVRRPIFRWLIFLAAIPLAIAGNVVRILLLVWGTEAFGEPFAVGTDVNPSAYHMGCGYVVYLIALLLLFGMISFINSKWVEGRLAALPGSSPESPGVLDKVPV